MHCPEGLSQASNHVVEKQFHPRRQSAAHVQLRGKHPDKCRKTTGHRKLHMCRGEHRRQTDIGPDRTNRLREWRLESMECLVGMSLPREASTGKKTNENLQRSDSVVWWVTVRWAEPAEDTGLRYVS
nr:uncharacterized protein LOC109406694 [Aedes albopictus]